MPVTKINGRTQPVEVQCSACGDEAETHPANLGYGLIFCDECASEYERASESPFESALWAKAGPR